MLNAVKGETPKMSSNTHSPCAACKFLRRKCTQECVFAPYFPPDQPQKFANVHRVYGASNVAKILNELNAAHREDAVTSLAYEAEARLRDPVYGCVGLISILQDRLKKLQTDLYNAKKDLSTYIGPQALMIPVFHPSPQPEMNGGGAMAVPMLGVPIGPQHGGHAGGQLVIRDQQQQMFEAQQQELVRFNVNGIENGNGFNQMAGGGGGGGGSNGVVSAVSLGLGGFDNNAFNNQMQAAAATHHHHHHQHSVDYQLQAQLMLQPQPKSEGEES